MNESEKHQFVTDFTSFIVIDEPSEPETPKPDKLPEPKPDGKTSDNADELEDKKEDTVEKKFMQDLNNQFSKTKTHPITTTRKPATQKPVDLKQKPVPKKPIAKKIIAPSKKSNTGAVFGDPHFMIFDKNEEPFCFNYQPTALSSMITLVRDPRSSLEINATVIGNGSTCERVDTFFAKDVPLRWACNHASLYENYWNKYQLTPGDRPLQANEKQIRNQSGNSSEK